MKPVPLEVIMMKRIGELQAEVERLTAFETLTIIPNEILQAQVEKLTAENAAVKLGNAEWKATAIERGDEIIHDNSVICDLREEVTRLRQMDSLKTVSLTDSTNWQSIGAYAELKEENARLKAEVENLTDVVSGLRISAEDDLHDIESARIENARLRASSFTTAVPVEQYERVLEAGDAMADVIGFAMARTDGQDPKLVRGWIAAKEGEIK